MNESMPTALLVEDDDEIRHFVRDLGMPEGGAVDYIVQVRQRSHVPMIVLAARVDDSDKMRTLNAGADEYMRKLFGMGAALERRAAPAPAATVWRM